MAGTISCTLRRLVPLLIVALAAVSVAAAADRPEVLVGRSIGAVRLGMTEAAVRAAYGAPTRVTSWRLGARSGSVARYGMLYVYVDASRVVAVETTSPRYRLADGVGIGTITPRRPSEFSFSWRGFRYDACTAAYRRTAHRAVTELLLPAGARTGRRIVSIAIADGPHQLLLPGTGRCD